MALTAAAASKRGGALTAAVLLLTVVLAGCASTDRPAPTAHEKAGILDPALREPLSEAIFEIGAHREQHFTGTTGIQLYIDWIEPDGEGPWPTIMGFTPYQGMDPLEAPGEGGDPAGVTGTGAGAPYSQALVDWFVPRGYAIAFADVRGNHEAGGCIDQTGPEQWQDGYDYVEWIAAQPWSDGNVGMWGASYVGETQFTTAMMDPPHLKTIVPVASVSNQYEWSFYQGVPYELQPFIGMFSYFTGSAQPSSDPNNLPYYPEKLECQAEQFGAGLDFSGDHTTFWKERDYRSMAGQINASVLHIHGLRDWNVRPIHIDPIFNDITAPKRAIFGQWGHAFPDRGDWAPDDGLENATVFDIQIAWYDHWLKGKQNGIMDILPPALIEDDTEQWWGIDSFPPLEQDWLRLELSGDGKLVAPGAATAGEFVIHDYPEEVLTGTGILPTATVGEAVIGHATQVTFTFKTTEELRLVGRPYVTFNATSSAASTHWVAHLTVDGKDCSARICDNHGYQDTRHRNGFDAPSDVEPSVPYALRIDMYPQYDVIPAGSTVRLSLLNNDGEVQQDPTNSQNRIMVGPDSPATLHLPLAPVQVPLPHDELPAVFPGYLDGSFQR